MATRMVHDLTYDAPVDTVAAMLTDKAFREEVCEALGATSYAVDVVDEGGSTKVTIDFWLPTDGVPSFAKKIAGDTTNIVLRETWTSTTRAEVHVSIPGKPGHMDGTATLMEEDGQTVETVDLDIKVRIPIVGGKIEDLIARLLGSSLRAENKVGRAYLTR